MVAALSILREPGQDAAGDPCGLASPRRQFDNDAGDALGSRARERILAGRQLHSWRCGMTWEVPTFVELRMDAEIGSYQDDFDREPDDRV